jgi:hypothetical protein
MIGQDTPFQFLPWDGLGVTAGADHAVASGDQMQGGRQPNSRCGSRNQNVHRFSL